MMLSSLLFLVLAVLFYLCTVGYVFWCVISPQRERAARCEVLFVTTVIVTAQVETDYKILLYFFLWLLLAVYITFTKEIAK